MEGWPIKRRRVYSPEPNKIAEAMFARKYLNHLVPALRKIKEKSSYNNDGDVKRVLKYEVEKALVLSAQGFQWSEALKLKLQEDHVNDESIAMKKCDQFQKLAGSEEDEEEEDDEKKLRRLRSLVPGGEEMCDDKQVVEELKSYVRCLQMQVNILQCLAHTH